MFKHIAEKLQIEQFKQFFGKKYQELQTKQQSSRHQDNNNKPATVTEKVLLNI